MKILVISLVLLLTGCADRMPLHEIEYAIEQCEKHDGLDYIVATALFRRFAKCNDKNEINLLLAPEPK